MKCWKLKVACFLLKIWSGLTVPLVSLLLPFAGRRWMALVEICASIVSLVFIVLAINYEILQ